MLSGIIIRIHSQGLSSSIEVSDDKKKCFLAHKIQWEIHLILFPYSKNTLNTPIKDITCIFEKHVVHKLLSTIVQF